MVRCAAVGCNNDSRKVRGIGYHYLFQRSDELQKEWLAKMKRGQFVPTQHTVLCEIHFTDDCFVRDLEAELMQIKRIRKLKEDAIPTLFSHIPERKRKVRPESEWQQTKQRKEEISVILANCSDDSFPSAVDPPTLDPPAPSPSTSGAVDPRASPMPTFVSTASQTENIIFPSISLKKTVTNKMTQTDSTPVPVMCDRSCETELPDTSDHAHSVTHDHGYFNSYLVGEAVTPSTNISSPQHTSTPLKLPLNTSVDIPVGDDELQYSFHENEESVLELSVTTTSQEDVSMYSPSVSSSGSTYSSASSSDSLDLGNKSAQDDRKYIVFETCLRDLFQRCQTCGEPVIHVERSVKGSQLKITTTCSSSHNFTWFSQPLVNKMGAGTLLTAASILFTGSTYSQFHSFADCLNLQLFSEKTFCTIQDKILFPVVYQEWKHIQAANLTAVQGRAVRLSGDGRCDSPGYNAKYCTYTMMDMDTNRVLDFSITHCSEVKYSVNMEKLGFERCLAKLHDEDVNIGVLATDRHVQITAAMNKEHKDIVHQFDVWHMAKSLSKKLTAAAKRKGCDALSKWIQSIVNWFWFCCASCNGDAVVLKDKWLSILHHIVNVHSWNSAEKCHACEHPSLTEDEERKKNFLKPDSMAHEELRGVILDKRFLKDMAKLTLFCHTGSLEVYHSLMLKYAPKRQHFSTKGMVVRTALTVMDQDENLNREQKLSTKGPNRGQPMYNQVFTKTKKNWIARPVYDQKTYNFTKRLLAETVRVQQTGSVLPGVQIPKDLPRNIATKERPAKQESVQRHQTRMKLQFDNA